jgi:galactokinase
VTAFAPGRGNLIGEHTDYNGGLSLPFAVAQGIRVKARPAPGHQLRVRSADQPEPVRLDPRQPPAERYGDWRDFVRGAVGELLAAGVALPGGELQIISEVPAGAGLSSSAALGVGLCLALLALGGADAPEPLELARLCSRIENDWVGAQTGLLDQLACLLGRPGAAVLIDFSTLATEHVPLRLGDWRLVAVDSGESHELAASEYGTRRRECERARDALGLEHLSQATLAQAEELPAPLDRRARHVLEENDRVRATVQALAREDLAALGAQLDASHASLRDLYEASTDAVESTVDRLKRCGAAGARMMGGGFGGSVLALFPPEATVPQDAVELAPSAGARLA